MKNSAATRITVSFFGFAAFLAVCGGAAIGQQTNPPAQKPARPHSTILTGYKNWTKVNAKPHRVLYELLIRCMVTPQEITEIEADPHKFKWVAVYVNKTAENAMLKRKRPSFPVGSIIVKEKLNQPGSKSPELLTVMRKRSAGYDPSNGDWEYLVFNGAANHVTAQGRLPKCQLCHNRWRTESDYVSPREYLSTKLQAGLK